LLKESRAWAADRIQLRIVDTERYSAEARQAEDQFGIKPATVRDSSEGEEDAEGIFIGGRLSPAARLVVIPFFHPGPSPSEYGTHAVHRQCPARSAGDRRRNHRREALFGWPRFSRRLSSAGASGRSFSEA